MELFIKILYLKNYALVSQFFITFVFVYRKNNNKIISFNNLAYSILSKDCAKRH
ncbi:hypothetical protein HMPREF9456_00768 [Dysgonomonas mossii DSM 22836]|uniref:Uncharacterized protein n=1 Tax=Dysgonomonas mossii DSM 22836 TaxID=742767 RepID=F8WXN3_9BACT|nr:hypothetical protein HMPREF9456_00768 [Dysgonomonas mossii DSM 22836]